jgi:4'-phosphopantetheinyl transferase
MILPQPNWPAGPAAPLLLAGEVHVWRVPLGNGPQFAACRAVLSPEEMARARRFVFAKDSERYITAHGALRLILSRYIPCEPWAIQFAAGEHGKPRLVAPPADVRFNLSHSGDWILIAVSSGREVGVDVEHVDEEIPFEQIAMRCFEPRDAWELRIAPPQQRVTLFFDLWTRMEARLKADGAGIGGEMRDERWSARNLSPARGYAGAVASEGEDWQLACWEWKL